ncbi:hypothetical protein AB0H83_24525 [Dactylosporangium sp. NPDC050688]|uniref:hypothetical protein n=1 Tax=Dactylosporangium sp. NPDC050688 TaxID=3157217 RepID=UPI0033DFB482
MSLARDRFVGTVAAVVALVATVTQKFVLQPLLWRVEPTALAFSVGMLAFVLALAGPVGGYLWLTRPPRRRPATFELAPAGQAFVVPPKHTVRGCWSIVMMWQAGNLIPYERVPDTDQIRLSTVPGVVPVFVALAAVLAVLAVVGLWLPGESLVLTPAGVTVRPALGRARDLRWEALLPGGPHPGGRLAMRLLYRTPDGRTKHLDVPLIHLDVDRVFVATVVRHYADHPERRHAIGTQQERERLRSAYTVWRARPVAVARPAT